MIRLAWRQFRVEASIGIGALAVVAVVLAITGPHLMSVYRTSPSELSSADHALQVLLAPLLLVSPALVGISFGAPLIARELETGTYRLAWTQSISRARWLVVKLAFVGLFSSAFVGGLSLMVAWWANPINVMNQNRFTPPNFGILGIVPFGYALFAFALGAMSGLVFKRTAPAMATALVGFVGVRLAVTDWVRAHFEAPAHLSEALNTGSSIGLSAAPSGLSIVAFPPNIPIAWPLSAQLVDKAGHVPTSTFLASVCAGLRASVGKGFVASIERARNVQPGPQESMRACLSNVAEKFHVVVTYQPTSRYWPFQMHETALFVALALALAGSSCWWVRRRLA